MSLAEQIKKRRIEMGYTQDELAKKVGYKSRSTINKIEKGINDITQSQIILFAKALECSPAYLMGWEECETEEIPPSASSFLKRLKEARKKRGLTIRQMADLLGVVASAYGQYEAGDRKPDFIKIMAISEILEVSTDYLFFGVDTVTNNNTHQLSELENKLVADFRKLNTSGKEKAYEYISDLTTMEKYIDADSDFKSKLG